MRLYLIRHAQSEANIGDFHSDIDTPLTGIGKEQAERTGKFFRDKKVDIILSSDALRAIDTTKIISKYVDSKIIYLHSLREIDHGIYAGKKRTDAEKQRILSGEDKIDFRPLNGENFIDLYQRAKTFISYLKEINSENVVCVSHGGFIVMFILALFDMPVEEKAYFGVKNCSITTIDLDSNFKVIKFRVNDFSHILKESPFFKNVNSRKNS